MPDFLTHNRTYFLIALSLLGALFIFNSIDKTPRHSATTNPQHPADTPDAISADNFAAHKALYAVKLSETRSGSQIVNISGQMMYEWQRTCDSWLSDHRFNMLYEYADTPPMRLISNFSTFEAIDGSALDFSSQRKSNGALFEEIRGFAEKDKATYRLPEDVSIDLDQGTFFPVAHTLQVAKQIRDGQKLFNAVIFDGSDTDGPIAVSSFIGKPIDPAFLFEGREGLDLSLLKSPAHKVRLAFFPLEEDQGAANYEMDIIFHENGVISDMVVEHNDFTITQKLIALEKLESQCEAE